MNEPVVVACQAVVGGWSCTVRVGPEGGTTEHGVSVSATELGRFAPNATEPTALVEQSFGFLLEREPRESILRRFALSDIERYFPEYPKVIAEASASSP
ncbi:MAG: hypothetical protein ACR2H0_08650 [Candidatus Limnocylindrales bacterium]